MQMARSRALGEFGTVPSFSMNKTNSARTLKPYKKVKQLKDRIYPTQAKAPYAARLNSGSPATATGLARLTASS